MSFMWINIFYFAIYCDNKMCIYENVCLNGSCLFCRNRIIGILVDFISKYRKHNGFGLADCQNVE